MVNVCLVPATLFHSFPRNARSESDCSELANDLIKFKICKIVLCATLKYISENFIWLNYSCIVISNMDASASNSSADKRRKNGRFLKKEDSNDSANDSQIPNGDLITENGSANNDPKIANGGLITEKMLEEERALEKKFASDERILKKKMAKEEKKVEEEKCYKRLNLLLSRSSIYATYMADKLDKHEALLKEKEKWKKDTTDNRGKGSGKRKSPESPAKKKLKPDVNIMDVYKKENMNSQVATEESSSLYVHPSSNIEDVLKVQPKLMTGGVMRQYQFDGFEWMKTLFENGVNGILADEMGLGKTIQCIAFISHLIEMGVCGPFFVCGPLSTVPNWYSEFQRFTPDIPLLLYHGDKKEREELRKNINIKVKVREGYCYPVVITSYTIALIDQSKLRNTEWKIMVIDEAHRIKNFQCKLIQALKEYNTVHRLLLTGTPLQNDLSELWSLLNFILPEIFDDLKVFQSWFDISRLSQNGITKEILAREQEKQIISTIHQILTPFLLRRTKSDVKLDIPNKKEVIVECPLSELQQNYYTSVLKHTIESLVNKEPKNELFKIVTDDGQRSKRVAKPTQYFGVGDNKIDFSKIKSLPPSVGEEDFKMSEIHLNTRNMTMCLRKICCHPYMISYPLDPTDESYLIDENIVRHSGKVMVLDVLLTELKKRGHKVLIFSQFVSMIEILQDYCCWRNHKYTCLIGSLRLQERQEEIRQFNEDPSTFLFLISTKAGGLGINLVAADTVVVFDSDWNPQGDLQAQDRCHRIGQTKPVVVYRLLVCNTVDEKVFDYAIAKRKLEKVIIQKGRFASKKTLTEAQPAITREELLELLESCEVNGFVKTDENCVLSPEELEKLLDRSDMMGECT